MNIKTSELTSAALDWAVAKCLDGKVSITDERGEWLVILHPTTRGATGGGNPFPPVFFCPSTDWAQGGPIIEREWIDLHCVNDSLWEAECPAACGLAMQNGPNPLTAAMRCYVYSKMGDTVQIPDELC